ncbi:MAG: EipA family protein [Pseudomonadota bacterium]
MNDQSRRLIVQSMLATGLVGLPACTSGQSQAPSRQPQGSGVDPNAAVGQQIDPETGQPIEDTYDETTILDAARNTFGSGAEGVAGLIERLFSENGKPNAYITGEEAGGGFIGALRYGGGTLYHKVEGERPIHWTGPSIGLELGGNAAKSFMLVYNLYDTEDVYARFPAVEGQGYFVGGLGVNYLQRRGVKVANVRLGIGLRYTANLGYVKFTKSSTINPF